MTRANSSFKQTLQGIRNLEKFDVNVIILSGKAPVLKHFSLCLPFDEPGFLDDRVPMLLMQALFWQKFGENRIEGKGMRILKSAYYGVF